MDHLKAHWASCSVDLPDPMLSRSLNHVITSLPESILRVKGCTKLDKDNYYSYFERLPSGMVNVREYKGKLITGPKLLVIGPGSEPKLLEKLVEESSNK